MPTASRTSASGGGSTRLRQCTIQKRRKGVWRCDARHSNEDVVVVVGTCRRIPMSPNSGQVLYTLAFTPARQHSGHPTIDQGCCRAAAFGDDRIARLLIRLGVRVPFCRSLCLTKCYPTASVCALDVDQKSVAVEWSCVHPGVLLALATLVHPTQETPRIILAHEVPLVAVHWLYIFFCGFFLLGLPGLYIAQSEQAGRLGLVSFLMLFFGTLFFAVSNDYGFIAPVLAARASAMLEAINAYPHVAALNGLLAVDNALAWW